MKNLFLLALLAFCTITVVACKSKQKTSTAKNEPVADAPLTNSRWGLRTMDGAAPVFTNPPREEVNIYFATDSDVIRGFGGCNALNGHYSASGGGAGKMNINSLMATKMFCKNGFNESRFMEVLTSTEEYKITGETLSLITNGKVTATFERILVH